MKLHSLLHGVEETTKDRGSPLWLKRCPTDPAHTLAAEHMVGVCISCSSATNSVFQLCNRTESSFFRLKRRCVLRCSFQLHVRPLGLYLVIVWRKGPRLV